MTREMPMVGRGIRGASYSKMMEPELKKEGDDHSPQTFRVVCPLRCYLPSAASHLQLPFCHQNQCSRLKNEQKCLRALTYSLSKLIYGSASNELSVQDFVPCTYSLHMREEQSLVCE